MVKWIQDNNVPVDLSFLKNYTPIPYPEAMAYTPQTSVTRSESGGPNFQRWTRTLTITGGVNYCNDLAIGTGGNPSGLAAGALGARPTEGNLAWSFNQGGQNYNVSAVSVDRKEKDGGYSRSDVDARLTVQGAMPLVLGRYFDSFDVGRTMFGYGWTAQPYALQFKGEPTGFNLCGQQWQGFAEVNFNDRAGERITKFVPSGLYNKTADPLHLASRFDPSREILVYSYETKASPGEIFTDSKTRYTMRLENGMLLDFDLTGLLTRVEDRNENKIDYNYDASKHLISISQPAGRTISFTYEGPVDQRRVASATLPDSHAVAYLYDANNNLTSAQVDAPTGRKLQYAYNASHEITEVRDETGSAVETRAFDAYGRVASTTQPGVATPIGQTFNLANRTSSASGPNGFSQATTFNANYDPTTITDARSNSETLTYNRYRDVITERKADQRTYQYYYDFTGRRMATVNPNGRADITYFDRNGNPAVRFHGSVDAQFTAQFDSEHAFIGNGIGAFPVDSTTFTYDAKGNLTKVIDANLHERNFAYDLNGNQSYARDGRSKQTDFTYDSFSRRTRVKTPLNHQTDFTYDERDNIKRVTTAAGTVDSNYNLRNERIDVTTGNVGARHTTAYTYNARGQIATVTDPAGFVTAYTYDARGNLTEIRHNNLVRFTYEYDGLNRLTATHYTGTAGGGTAAISPLTPRGGETLKDGITITWQAYGDWTANPLVTLQYSIDGVNWIDIATVNYATGSYVWNTGVLTSTTVQIRFVHAGDATFHTAITSVFRVLNGRRFYVNDASTVGDQYCTAAGQTYNGTTVTGQTPANPVNSVQAIISNNVLQPGDTIYVDTGSYAITSSIAITENDAGTVSKPVTITGPTNSGAAVFTFQNATTLDECLLIYYAGTVGKKAEGIVIEHLKFTGGYVGIGLLNTTDCIVRYNECYGNGVNAPAGTKGAGYGIVAQDGGNNTIENNVCYANGANGGAGNIPSMNGGTGQGRGIEIYGSSGNRVRFNTCHHNGGRGGAAGSATSLAGGSEGIGIHLYGVASPVNDNQVTDNICYANDALGRDETQADGSNAFSYGIKLVSTTNSNIERNVAYQNTGTGGLSWNGTSGGKGGRAVGWGIYGDGAAGLIVTKNVSYENAGNGGRGGTDAVDKVGNGSGIGIGLYNCQNAIIKNNLCYANLGRTWGTFGGELAGTAFATGIDVATSPGSLILNNTLIQNKGLVYVSGGTQRSFGDIAQLFIHFASANAVIKNNILDMAQGGFSAVSVSSNSTSGTVSNSNDFYVQGTALFGVWGTTSGSTLQGWKTASGQDAASVAVDPKYYDASAKNYHLAATSPVIDVGETLAQAEEDADGENRPADGNGDLVARQDIGYDEFIDSDRDGLADVIELTVSHTNPNEPDSDFDGLPDGWEVANALDPNSAVGANGASGNPDGDGYTNLQEYLGGSNPQLMSSVPAQPPTISAFAPSGSNLFILEQDSVAFSATATDANSEPIGYSWLLDGVQQSTANAWAFTTNDESSGVTTLAKSYLIELRVTAGADTITRQWTVVVNNRNRAPILAQLANFTVYAGETITLNPSVSDPDNQNGVPGDNNVLTVQYTGFMTGPTKIAAIADAGLHTVTVTVRDNGLPVFSEEQSIQIRVIADSDRDGIPDEVELANGFNPNNAADAALDTDGDGVNNLKEYLADTNPRNPGSVFRISAISRSGNNVLISFTSSATKRYRVERTSDVTSGPWTTVTDNVQGTGAMIQVTDANAITAGRSFYRAVVLP